MDKYKNRYRIAPARAQWWDYGWDAAYFITICIRNRECLFGEVRDKKMILSDLGKIADTSWNDIPNHSKNITLGPSVTMPNHVHGICILTGNQVPFKFVETRHALSLRIDTGDPPITVGQMRSRNPGKNNLSTIIGDTNPPYPKRHIAQDLIFNGNHVFMTTSFVIRMNTNELSDIF